MRRVYQIPSILHYMELTRRIELLTFALQVQCSAKLSYVSKMAGDARIELAYVRVKVSCRTTWRIPLKHEKGKMEKPFLLSTKVQRYLQGLDVSFCFLNTHVSYLGIVAMLVIPLAQRFPNLFSHLITS